MKDHRIIDSIKDRNDSSNLSIYTEVVMHLWKWMNYLTYNPSTTSLLPVGDIVAQIVFYKLQKNEHTGFGLFDFFKTFAFLSTYVSSTKALRIQYMNAPQLWKTILIWNVHLQESRGMKNC